MKNIPYDKDCPLQRVEEGDAVEISVMHFPNKLVRDKDMKKYGHIPDGVYHAVAVAPYKLKCEQHPELSGYYNYWHGEKITHYTVTSGSASFNTFAEYDDAKQYAEKIKDDFFLNIEGNRDWDKPLVEKYKIFGLTDKEIEWLRDAVCKYSQEEIKDKEQNQFFLDFIERLEKTTKSEECNYD